MKNIKIEGRDGEYSISFDVSNGDISGNIDGKFLSKQNLEETLKSIDKIHFTLGGLIHYKDKYNYSCNISIHDDRDRFSLLLFTHNDDMD